MQNIFFGGDFSRHDSFRNILSIGYEFETHDLAKLSLSDGVLINTSITNPEMSKRITNGLAEKIDDNNYEIIDETEDDALYYTEYFDEYDGVVSDNVMHITNDIGSTPFEIMLNRKCNKLSDEEDDEDVPKNDIYVFKSVDREFDIHFDSTMLNRSCSVFSGVEYVMTYMRIKRSNDIIMQTFLNACHRIFSHLDKLEKIPGQLFLKDGSKIGHLESRMLYHKPKTNVYYLQTHDSDVHFNEYSLGKSSFMPQMTFRANNRHIIQIMKDIVDITNLTTIKRTKRIIMAEKNTLSDIESCIGELFEKYNASSKKALTKQNINNITAYLFMIFYKIYAFVEEYQFTDQEDAENYFKDYLSFASRHNNYLFYEKIKEALNPRYGKDTPSVILDIINQPDVIGKYFYSGRKKKALKTRLYPGDKHYGNPAYSLLSYFQHYETPTIKDESDTDPQREWFISNNVDVFSTTFDIPSDGSIIIENRLFFYELVAFAKDYTDVYAPISFSLNNLKTIYSKLIKTKKVEDLSEKEINPETNRFVQKCKPGKKRDEQFVCRSVKKSNKKKSKSNKKKSKSNKKSYKKTHSKTRKTKPTNV